MESHSRRQRLTVPIAATVAGAAALAIAAAVLAMPGTVLEDMVLDSGIAAFVTAAEPPLGLTARLAIALAAAGAIGGLLWVGLRLLIGDRDFTIRVPGRVPGRAASGPRVRRADAHPDAPPRRPVFAHRDLGTPFLDVRAAPIPEEERAIPADLDTPLARYLHPLDRPLPVAPPGIDFEALDALEPLPIRHDLSGPSESALPIGDASPVPVAAFAMAEPVGEPPAGPVAAQSATSPVAPSSEPVDLAGEARIETFELTPMVRPAPAAVIEEAMPAEPSAPLEPATIHDLLARLERGVARRVPISEPAEPAPQAAPVPASHEPPSTPTPISGSLEQTLGVLRQLAARVG